MVKSVMRSSSQHSLKDLLCTMSEAVQVCVFGAVQSSESFTIEHFKLLLTLACFSQIAHPASHSYKICETALQSNLE